MEEGLRQYRAHRQRDEAVRRFAAGQSCAARHGAQRGSAVQSGNCCGVCAQALDLERAEYERALRCEPCSCASCVLAGERLAELGINAGSLRVTAPPQPLKLPVVRIAAGVAAGLNFVHSAGHDHCDVKSANVLLDEHYVARICDFGESKVRKTPSWPRSWANFGL